MPKLKQDDPISADAALAGILALMAVERDERVTGKASPIKTEVLLVEAGLTFGQAARILGKNYQAVQKSVYRSRAKDSGDAPPPS
jgi:hypothetical protein